MECSPKKPTSAQLSALDTFLANDSRRKQLLADLKAIMAGVDVPQLDLLRKRYAEEIERSTPASEYKYIDIVFWCYYKLRLAESLGLRDLTEKLILDIGAGAGHFPMICRYLGHSVTAIDIENRFYDELASCLGVQRDICRVRPEVPLPDFGHRFDLVTAIAINFNSVFTGTGRVYWTLAQWRFFIDDIGENQLRYPGELYLELNHEYRGKNLIFNKDLLSLCEDNGATVSRQFGKIKFQYDAPKKLR